MGKNIKTLTKNSDGWATTGETVTHSDLQLSCLMRIADATEQMALPFARMVEELERYKRWYLESQQEIQFLKNSIAGHKAAFTKLKNKQSSEVQQ